MYLSSRITATSSAGLVPELDPVALGLFPELLTGFPAAGPDDFGLPEFPGDVGEGADGVAGTPGAAGDVGDVGEAGAVGDVGEVGGGGVTDGGGDAVTTGADGAGGGGGGGAAGVLPHTSEERSLSVPPLLYARTAKQ